MNSIPHIDGRKNIFVCPLNWGLGHATRCIPIIKQLISNGHHVTIGASGRPLALLKNELKESAYYIEYDGITVKYSNSSSQTWSIIKSLPKWTWQSWKEHRTLDEITRKHNIDIVISDNRFGAWNKNARSVYITHQVMIKAPKKLKWSEPLLHWLHGLIISRYDECWIADNENNGGLSGDLAHKYSKPRNATFIGTLSRLNCAEEEDVEDFDTLAIVSGPEPQRTIFENEIISRTANNTEYGKVMIVSGKPECTARASLSDNITTVSHLSSGQMKRAIKTAKRIVCRSGYSTLMDLDAMGATAEICPTPGQSEQEYLAEYAVAKGLHKRWT